MCYPNSRLPFGGFPAVVIGFMLAACSGPVATEASPAIPSQDRVSEFQVIEVPLGSRPELDGTLLPGEWDQAIQIDMSNGGEAYFLHDGENLYVGISADSLGFGHLCWQREDQIWILHSSASLGSAGYQADGPIWRPSWDYEWCCPSLLSREESQALFEREGWTATIGYLGDPGQMEYQIAWDGQVHLAVLYQTGQEQDTIFAWPQTLADACLDLALGSGELLDPAIFDLQTWGFLTAASQ